MAEALSVFPFTYHPSVAEFAVPKHVYLAARKGTLAFGYIATATLVLDTTSDLSKPRVLLLQRAASDELPNKWEPPGGAVDDDDVSILHAAARELMEEAGIRASVIGERVGEPYYFPLDNGGTVCQFSFVVHVGLRTEVKLDPAEHQDYVWATEEEVKAGKVGDMELDFTSEEVLRWVLELYEYARREQKKRAGA